MNVQIQVWPVKHRGGRELFKNEFQLVWIRWWYDYPDPNNGYGDMFYSQKSSGKRQAWSNAEFDDSGQPGQGRARSRGAAGDLQAGRARHPGRRRVHPGGLSRRPVRVQAVGEGCADEPAGIHCSAGQHLRPHVRRMSASKGGQRNSLPRLLAACIDDDRGCGNAAPVVVSRRLTRAAIATLDLCGVGYSCEHMPALAGDDVAASDWIGTGGNRERRTTASRVRLVERRAPALGRIARSMSPNWAGRRSARCSRGFAPIAVMRRTSCTFSACRSIWSGWSARCGWCASTLEYSLDELTDASLDLLRSQQRSTKIPTSGPWRLRRKPPASGSRRSASTPRC